MPGILFALTLRRGRRYPGRKPERAPLVLGAIALLCLSVGCSQAVVPLPTLRIAASDYGSGAARATRPVYVKGAASAAANSLSKTDSEGTSLTGATGAEMAPLESQSIDQLVSQIEASPPPVLKADRRASDQIAAARSRFPAPVNLSKAGVETPETPGTTATAANLVDAPVQPWGTARKIGLNGLAHEVADLRFARSQPQAIVLWAPEEAPLRLERYDLPAGQAVAAVELPDQATVLAVSPDGHRVAVRLSGGLPDGRAYDSQGRIDIYSLASSPGKHLIGWNPAANAAGEGSSDAASVPLAAAFPTASQIAIFTADGRLTLWNLEESKAVYSVLVQPGGARTVGPLLVSPGGKWLAVYTGDGFQTFNAADGKSLGKLAFEGGGTADCSLAAISPDGTTLAALVRRPGQSIVHWNLKTGSVSGETPATLALNDEHGVGTGMSFGENETVLTSGVLFNSQGPLWLYQGSDVARNIADSPDNHHWVVLDSTGTAELVPLDAPAAAIAPLLAKTPALPTALIAPGVSVSTRLGLENPLLGATLTESLTAAPIADALGQRGWRADAAASHALEIEVRIVQPGQTVNFTKSDGSTLELPATRLTAKATLADSSGTPLWTDEHSLPMASTLPLAADPLQVLKEQLWDAAPQVVESLLAEMPAYVHFPGVDQRLGATRLWLGPNDVAPPHGADGKEIVASTAESADDTMTASAGSAMPLAPVTTLSAQGNGGVIDLAVLPDPPGWLAAVGNDGTIRFFERQNLSRVTDEKYRQGITRLFVPSNNKSLVYGTADGKVRVFDLYRKSTIGTFSGATGRVTALYVSDDAKVFAGDSTGLVSQWTDTERIRPEKFGTTGAAVTGIVPATDSSRLLVSRADGTLHRLELGLGIEVPLLKRNGAILALAVAPDRSTAVIATDQGAVLIDASNGKELAVLGEQPATALLFVDNSRLLVGSRNGEITVWDVASRTATHRLTGMTQPIAAVAVSSDGTKVAASAAESPDVPIWALNAAAAP